ncbi:MAG: hypothetical protein IT324_15965 [Anaerolineae bacterium]|nr:hypothetical protein [Anaerolineae bacterium]
MLRKDAKRITLTEPWVEPQVITEDETSDEVRTDSAVSAVFLAAGIASAVFGVLVIASEVSPRWNKMLTFMPSIGPLSGEAVLSILVFALGWPALFAIFRVRAVKMNVAFIVSMILTAVGFILTYPPVGFALRSLFTGR